MYMPTALADPKITYTHSPCICLPLWPTLYTSVNAAGMQQADGAGIQQADGAGMQQAAR